MTARKAITGHRATMLASDPRYPDYAALQQSLCVALNMHVHWDSAHLPIDWLVWHYGYGDEKPLREQAAEAFKAEMRLVLEGGLDD